MQEKPQFRCVQILKPVMHGASWMKKGECTLSSAINQEVCML